MYLILCDVTHIYIVSYYIILSYKYIIILYTKKTQIEIEIEVSVFLGR